MSVVQAGKEWRVVTEYLERLAAQNKDTRSANPGQEDSLVVIDEGICSPFPSSPLCVYVCICLPFSLPVSLSVSFSVSVCLPVCLSLSQSVLSPSVSNDYLQYILIYIAIII